MFSQKNLKLFTDQLAKWLLIGIGATLGLTEATAQAYHQWPSDTVSTVIEYK